jgi:hypothetical protein
MAATCWRCGDPTDDDGRGTQPVCTRCRTVTRSVVGRRHAPEAVRRHSFPVVEEYQVDGLRLGVLEVEDWTTCFVLRYAVFPRNDGSVAVNVDEFERMHLGLWHVTSDQGTDHYGIGAQAEARESRYAGDIWFAPALVTGTRALSISFRQPRADTDGTLTIEMPLDRWAP